MDFYLVFFYLKTKQKNPTVLESLALFCYKVTQKGC